MTLSVLFVNLVIHWQVLLNLRLLNEGGNRLLRTSICARHPLFVDNWHCFQICDIGAFYHEHGAPNFYYITYFQRV
jgi:hypothetical protein